MTASDSPGIRGAALIAGAVVFSAILLIFFLPDKEFESPMRSTGSSYGRIQVDSPEVYTRERMVNDRFRQEAWLLDQLKELTEEEPGVQGVVDGQQTRSRSADLSVAQGGTIPSGIGESELDVSNTEATGNIDQLQTNATETGQPQLTPIEIFRGRQAFGEEVRNAIIENQLDDRHDLGGNTLYRLKFDATVIPGNDTSAWAWVNVRFRRIEDDNNKDEEKRELYKRWMDDLRERVNSTYLDKISKELDENAKKRIYEYGLSLFLANMTDEHKKDRNQFEDLECVKNLDNRDFAYSAKNYECLMKGLPKISLCAPDDCEKWLANSIVLEEVIYDFGTDLGQKADVRKRQKHGALQRSSRGSDETQGQRFVSFIPNHSSVLVEEYTTSFLAVPLELTDGERNANFSEAGVLVVPLELNDSERNAYHNVWGADVPDAKILDGWNEYLGCDEPIQISVAERLFKICAASLEEIRLAGPDSGGEGVYEIEAKLVADSDGQPMVVESISDEKIREEWRGYLECDSKQLQIISVADRLLEICPASLPEIKFAEDAVSGEYPLIEGEIIADADGQPNVTAKVGFLGFKNKLQKSYAKKFLFSYAVTPRESSQQLASSSRLALSEKVQANASGNMGGAGGDVSAGRSSLFSEYARIMERRPIVVGIAGQASAVDEQLAQFGWLIGPKLVVGPDGQATYRHLPSQNSLAALVSAPSWWRRADIEIETGWLDDQGNPIADSVKVKYEIALPGDQDEITSKLLLGGKRPAPSVGKVSPETVKVNEKARILIEGQNLWRSTVVTIGAQRSKRIFVLPNMKGIIAEFDAIDAQATRPNGEGSEAMLRVWTSEGVANWDHGIRIEQE